MLDALIIILLDADKSITFKLHTSENSREGERQAEILFCCGISEFSAFLIFARGMEQNQRIVHFVVKEA